MKPSLIVPSCRNTFCRNVVLSILCTSLLWLSGCSRHVTHIPDSSETIANWQLARNYHGQGRLELARQYYVLALASARSPEVQVALQREIDAADRMLQAMR